MNKRIHLALFLISAIIIVFGQNGSNNNYFNLPKNVTEKNYLPKTIIYKLKPVYKTKTLSNTEQFNKFDNILKSINAEKNIQKFPHSSVPQNKSNNGFDYVDLSLVYQINYESNLPIERIINELYQTGVIEYAQPYYIEDDILGGIPKDTVNDPKIASQYYLDTIKAYEAWRICRGDTNVVVAIVDTGSDTSHLDLKTQIKYNYEDPIDGKDNDGDGFIDNFFGWDMGNNDNNSNCENSDNPNCSKCSHGIHVSGIAAAATNNKIGMAGIGYKCKLLPVKINDSTNSLVMSYEGIVYAANHHAQIINCSWGGVVGMGQFGQDIINYATNNKNCLVIAAAGNDNTDNIYFPASYDNVLSVAATNYKDEKWTDTTKNNWGSTYNVNVDICAPGNNIYSTWRGGQWITSSGTSMAAPVVAGCAAIVKSFYKNYTGLQVGEQLKATTDNIYNINYNKKYLGKLGTGRVNLYRALTENTSPSAKMIKHHYSEKDYGHFTKNDTMKMVFDFINYLAPSKKLYAILTSTSPHVKVIDTITYLGVINTMAIANNKSDPFEVVLNPSIPLSTPISFTIKFVDDNYSNLQYFQILLNIDYIDLDTNKIAVTITSKSRLGYNESFQQGVGFTYKNGPTLFNCAGLLLATSESKVVDDIYGSLGGMNNWFTPITNAKRIYPPKIGDVQICSSYNDSLATTNKIGVKVLQSTYAWNKTNHDKYVIVEYTVINKNKTSLSNLYIGFYADWNIKNYFKNSILFDTANRMGYSFSYDGGTYTGIKLLTNTTAHHYAFDNDGVNGSFQITTVNNEQISYSFNTYKKYNTMRATRDVAGDLSMGKGNDVSDMISTGPFNSINPDDSIKIAFALIAGDHLKDIQNSAIFAQKHYNKDTTSISESFFNKNEDIVLMQNYPNPFKETTYINTYFNKSMNVKLSVYNILGKQVITIVDGKVEKGSHVYEINSTELKPGLYLYTLKTDTYTETRRMTIIGQ